MRLRRLLPVLVALGCGEPDPAPPGAPPAPRPAPANPAPGNPPPPRPGGPEQDPHRARLEGEVIEATASSIRVLTPEGDTTFDVAPGAYGTPPASSSTVTLDCTIDPGGRYTVATLLPHQGLEIDYGVVSALSPDRLVITRPLGEGSYRVNRWSDLPKDLAVGQYVGVKHYRTDEGPAILNTRRFPGRVEIAGVVTAAGETLTIASLGGARTFPVTGPAVGDVVVVHHRRGRTGAPEDLGVDVIEGPLPFTGKISAWDARTNTVAMVDAWGGTLGNVKLATPNPLPGDLVPGDLADVRWTAVAGVPTVVSIAERKLSPVFFGRIDAIDAGNVEMTTLQRQHKQLRRTPATWLPVPIAVGDMADVIWVEDPAGGPPVAEVIVKE